jgi:hypothetical protein
MTPRSDPNHASLQRAAWVSLWKILLAPRPDGGAGQESGPDPTTSPGSGPHGVIASPVVPDQEPEATS